MQWAACWGRRGDPEYQRKEPRSTKEERGGLGTIRTGSEGFQPAVFHAFVFFVVTEDLPF